MSDPINIDPDITPEAPDEHAPTTQHEDADVEVTSPDEVDPDDGTDDDDVPVDNPAG